MPPHHRLLPALRVLRLTRNYHPSPALLREGIRADDVIRSDHPRIPTTHLVEDASKPSAARSDAFSSLNMYSDLPEPASAVETIYNDGFLFTSGASFHDGSGAFMVHNEAFKWRPAEVGSEIEAKALKTGVLELAEEAWGMLDVVHPKPELLIVGTGRRSLLLSPKDRDRITELGIRMDVMDTAHAAAQYNLLATERVGGEIAAALLADEFGAKKTAAK